MSKQQLDPKAVQRLAAYFNTSEEEIRRVAAGEAGTRVNVADGEDRIQ